MNNTSKLYTIQQAIEKIKENRILVIAGDEALIKQLPSGKWIAGTINHFMDTNGGVVSKDKLHIDDFTDNISEFKITDYSEKDVLSITAESYRNGFSYLVMPLNSPVHQAYGKSTMHMTDLCINPVVGWVAGLEENETKGLSPKVFNGETLEIFENRIAALHCRLANGKQARIEIVNLFSQGNGDTVEFSRYGFTQSDCLVNGKKQNIYDYITSNNIDEKLPFMTDMGGAMINVHPLTLNHKEKTVKMAAAVFPEFTYRLASPIDDYAAEFQKRVPSDTHNIIATISCYANYKYLGLKEKSFGEFTGPLAFGEVGFILFNQTMVLLYIEDK